MPTRVIHITQYTDFEEDLDKLFVEGYEVKAIVPEGRTTCGMIVLYKPATPPVTIPTFAEMLAALVDDKCQRIKHADGKAHVAKEPDPHNEDLDGFVCTGENMHPKTSCDIFSVIAWMQLYDDMPVNWHMGDA